MNYYLAAVLAGFLIGSLPWGLWIGRLATGRDVRSLGSGNLGATNVFRSIGPLWGILVLLLDAGKGYMATAIFPSLLPGHETYPYLRLIGGLAAVAGHVLTPFASFKGGKGVATTCGVFLGLAPLATGMSFGVWAVFVAASGIVSLASMVAALVLPVAVYVTRATVRNHWEAVLILSLVLSLIIWVRHRSNLRRLMNGTEKSLWRRGMER
jgi:glycerol-3-phosphate acyltransferase PlsY